MKINVYEVREDEKSALERVMKKLGDEHEVRVSSGRLGLDSLDSLDGAEAVVTLNQSDLSAEGLERLSDHGVRYVATRTIGYNHIDLDAARRLGIRVCNATYPPYGVAEFAVMLMLMTLRRAKNAIMRSEVNDYSLGGLMGRELRFMTVGVVGTGNIGKAVIEALTGFGCKILAYDPYPSADVEERYGATYVDLDKLLEQSDLVTLHIPLLDATHHIIDADAISKMRDGAVLINVSRGELVDTAALIEAVESGKLSGVGMDVFENEDGIYHFDLRDKAPANRDMAYLRQFPNVVLTHHIAFYTETDVASMVEQGVGGVVAMSKGACPTEL